MYIEESLVEKRNHLTLLYEKMRRVMITVNLEFQVAIPIHEEEIFILLNLFHLFVYRKSRLDEKRNHMTSLYEKMHRVTITKSIEFHVTISIHEEEIFILLNLFQLFVYRNEKSPVERKKQFDIVI